MFERYLSDLVTAHFGHVVENLDAEKMRISAWNGELVLRDLVLRKQALDNIMGDQSPVEVAYGKVGHLELRLPWKLIRSQLWRSSSVSAGDSSRYGISIVLTDVNILLTPRQQSPNSEEVDPLEETNNNNLSEEEKRVRREEKVQDLLAAALLKRVTQSASSQGKPGAKPNRWQWARDFASRLLSNLSITVRNIHIRYEDPGSCMGFKWKPDDAFNKPQQRYRPGFAIGITLHQFSVQTAEPSKVGFGKSDPARLQAKEDGALEDEQKTKALHTIHHKIAAAYRLAIYWDSDSNLISVNRQMMDGNELMFSLDDESDAAPDYYAASFAALGGNASPDFGHGDLYQAKHFYVLEHVSPSLALSLVAAKSAPTDVSKVSTSGSSEIVESVDPKASSIEPPSELNLILPPCHFSVNRGMLEDIAYLRRSFSLWRHDKKGLFSDSALRHLTTLRPTTSVRSNPRAWWKYAFEATKMLNIATRKESLTDPRVGRRYPGWVGLAKALGQRKQYINLYRRLLDAKVDVDQAEIHASLLQMEDGLYEEEIVVFRLAAYSELSEKATMVRDDGGLDDSNKGKKTKPRTMTSQQSSLESQKQGSQVGSDSQHFLLTVEHRCRIFEEVTLALERDKSSGGETPEGDGSTKQEGPKLALTKPDAIVWRALMQCPEFSLQVNDQQSGSRSVAQRSDTILWTPVVRVSFAWVQDQLVREDGSWEIDCKVASFTAADMTGIQSPSAKMFPNLIGRKSGQVQPEDVIVIDGMEHYRSLGVTIKRKRPPNEVEGKSTRNEGSTTWTQIRVSPLEVVYATVPVEALSRVFASVKTPELADDFQRMKSVVFSWREKQKRRLLQALAHRQKKIFVDVDASAPLFLIPEDVTKEDSPMVVIDLGRLRFHNSELEPSVATQKYDSKWQLSVSDIQVQCSLASVLLRSMADGKPNYEDDSSWQHMVEPFSLDFSIETKTCQSDAEATRIFATAVLPRLVFNLTSSAVRLVLRLKNQWAERKSELERKGHNRRADPVLNKVSNDATQDGTALIVGFEFKLSAPLVAVRLENDVDGRDCLVLHDSNDVKVLSRQHTTRIINLSLRGIQGRVVKELSATGKSTLRFEAKLHSLDAVDLYQAAGDDFSLLLSSRSPDSLAMNFPSDHRLNWQSILDNDDGFPVLQGSDTDLVSFEYFSSSTTITNTGRVEITFHELYAEWNPETIAAIQKATRLPVNMIADQEVEPQLNSSRAEVGLESDDEFFDAVEDFANDDGSESHSEMHIVSEISSTPSSSFSDAAECQTTEPISRATPAGSYILNGFHLHTQIQPTIALSPTRSRETASNMLETGSHNSAFEVSFKLKKLRVRFNKESRHRRLLTAEMDETAVHFATKPTGGSRTCVTIGNLVFVDSSGGPASTLYGEILGLQAQSSQSSTKPSSLLNMEIEIHRKERNKGDVEVSQISDASSGVTIDSVNGRVSGSDYYVKAHLSPMRFVFLEQLWFEIIDYFFEGIIGSSVWGGRKASPPPDLTIEPSFNKGALMHGCDAEGVSFTRFDFVLEAPVVLLPVTYRSTQFIRLVTDAIIVKNHYKGSVESMSKAEDENKHTDWLQWYNNCVVEIVNLKLISWNGVELTKGNEAVGARVIVKWPTGPLSRLLAPKWNVDCRFDNLNLAIRPQDCALLQHIVLHNIGEPSRHIDEWDALQSLPQQDLLRYREQIMVHFGYDKKDVTPSTFKVIVALPSVKLSLVTESGRGDTVAQAWCTKFTWSLVKLPDCISRQRITCDIDLLDPSGDGEPVKMIVPAKSENENPYELTYTSVSRPNGDNAKSLQISNACIYFVYPSWMKFVRFFQGLPDPVILTEMDVNQSIQVGDHWYRIDGGSPRSRANIISPGDSESATTPWKERRESLAKQLDAQPTNQFRLLLITPSIVLPSTAATVDKKSVVLRVERLDYLNKIGGPMKTTSRFLCLHDLELYTCSGQHEGKESKEYSLIHPWSVVARVAVSSLNSIQIKSDVFRARAAFSDMTVVLEVMLSLLADIRAFEMSTSSAAQATCRPSEPAAATTVPSHDKSLAPDSSTGHNQLRRSFGLECAGFELLIIDDSRRHFADAQDLVIVRLGKLIATLEDFTSDDVATVSSGAGTELSQQRNTESTEYTMRAFYTIEARLHSFEVLDCLQSATSPFRVVATSRLGLLDKTESILHWYDSSNWTNEYDEPVEPQLSLLEYSSRDGEEWGFSSGAAFDSLLNMNDGEAKLDNSPKDLTDLTVCIRPGMTSSYELKLRSIAMQWNPSTVIALQRFLGRLMKEARTEAVNTVGKPLEQVIIRKHGPIDDAETDAVSDESSRKIRFSIGNVTICLNKEHQNRRLLQLTLSECLVSADHDQNGFGVACEVGNLTAVDTDNYDARGGVPLMIPDNRFVLKMAWADEQIRESKRQSFLRLRYVSYMGSTKRPPIMAADVPLWVRSKLLASKSGQMSPDGTFDDFLSVSIARLQFSFIRERTEEILDYLSNGLPGKGMGATTRAAQGFLKERIQTRSFLELNVEAPNIVVPQDESASRGLILRLGDVRIQSWFEEGSLEGPVNNKVGSSASDKENTEWWRMLSLTLSGLCGGSWKLGGESSESGFSVCSKPIDLSVLLQKPTWRCKTSTLHGNLSFVDLVLSYSDYVLLQSILRSNVGRRIDRDRWDNVEKSFWMEQQDLDAGIGLDVASSIIRPGISAFAGSFKHVTYSSSARFVRYGRQRSGTPKSIDSTAASSSVVWTELDVKFELRGLSLKLRRDDIVGLIGYGASSSEIDATFNYDLILLTVQVVELSFSANSAGDKSFHLSLFTLGLFDLGESGRLARESYFNTLLLEKETSPSITGGQSRLPCAFTVIAEGYSSFEGNSGRIEGANVDPQILVTVDTCAASSIGATGLVSKTSGLPQSDRVTVARIVVNFLTVNALIRPLKEVLAFLSCAWASPNDPANAERDCNNDGAASTRTQSSDPRPTNQQRSSNVQLKLVAHYPRIFFVADESDIHSRALVLTGLAVVNASLMSHTSSQNNSLSQLPLEMSAATVDAQLHRMESYINPDVSNALGLKHRHVALLSPMIAGQHLSMSGDDFETVGDQGDMLGVALIQPVTVGVEFSRDCRSFFPTTRFVSVNMEPVSTMLSFEDLQLIEVVLRRWSARRSRNPAETPTTSASDDTSPQEKNLTARNRAKKLAAFGTSKPSQIMFEAIFHSSRLGLGLRRESHGVVVDQVLDSEHSARIKVGDILVSVNGFNVLSKSLSNVVQLLSNTSRPTTLKFCRREPSSVPLGFEYGSEVQQVVPNMSDNTDNSNTTQSQDKGLNQKKDELGRLTIKLRRGIRNGLLLERSSSGDVPIVSGIERTFLSESMMTAVVLPGDGRIPYVGAAVVGVNDKSSLELGFEGTLSYIDDLCLNVADLPETGSDESENATYTLTFVELPSVAWGTLDTVDFSLSGVVLTFIDDLKGRDMPLFRGKLGPIVVHLEKGKGLETSIVGGSPLQELLQADLGETTDNSPEYIVKLSALTRAGVEYFHPKIAIWEPLLEPSQLCFLLERRAGYVAIEISDHLQRNKRPGSQHIYSGDILPRLVCLNLSDAAVEVIAQALREWLEWRRGLTVAIPDEDKLLDQDISLLGKLYLSQGEITDSLADLGTTASFDREESVSPEDQILMKYRIAKKFAAQKAAQAALVFAQKRGAGTHEKGEPAKPFVFRNRTGISVAFAQQSSFSGNRSSNNNISGEIGASRFLSVVGEYVGLEDYDSAVVTELADGQEAKFTMDADFDGTNKDDVDADYTSFNSKTATKVRKYDGRFPRLTVAIQAVAGVNVEALTDLPVVKVGTSVRPLRVRKEFPHAHSVVEYVIPVLWEVEIEDNRRILTLSSAVRIECLALGTSIEVGVTNNSPDGATTAKRTPPKVDATRSVKSVGFSRPGCPFFLPIWLALKLEVVCVHIRPNFGAKSALRWGEQSVLEFGSKQAISNSIDPGFAGLSHGGEIGGEWFWKESFVDSRLIECAPEDRMGATHSAWLSCHVSRRRDSIKGKDPNLLPRHAHPTTMRSILSISVDSSLTIRNLLPTKIEWEVASQSKETEPKILDGSSFRQHLDERLFPTPEPLTGQTCSLPSGDCVEVFACESGATPIVARFKCDGLPRWSNWAPITFPPGDNVANDTNSEDARRSSEAKRDDEASLLFSARQVNLQIRTDFGVPITIGLKNVPKAAKSPLDGAVGTSYYGVEVIVYAEVWFRNLTTLPLNIGCPTRQMVGPIDITEKDIEEKANEERAAKFTAEAALMEMASVLEFGEKGTGLTSRNGYQSLESFEIRSLPLQESNIIVEEVFEYVEIEKSAVKRRWWASENYDSLRPNLTDVEDTGQDWRWIDQSWNIDCLGTESAVNGGWESCRSLVGEKENVFSIKREFNPSHNFRRRRWFRRRESRDTRFCCGVQAYHQPIPDVLSVAQIQSRQNRLGGSADPNYRSTDLKADTVGEDANLRICVNVGGGCWSTPAVIPLSGSAHGVLRAGASRWPRMTKLNPRKTWRDNDAENSVDYLTETKTKYCSPDLSPKLFELCYNVSDLEGDWGEFSRLMLFSARFFVRNDSMELTMEVKQTGAPDETMLRLTPGEASPFHWADFRLPELVSVRPSIGKGTTVFKWSGGFDICSLGMTAVRVRQTHRMSSHPSNQILQVGYPFECLRSVRATVEIRRGTGGSGINVSLQEEDPTGDGSLFRIENLSTFPIWLAQDGVLANPAASVEQVRYTDSTLQKGTSVGWNDDHAGVDGDLILPGDKMSFALDVPFRQGKYAGRQAASVSELLRVRVALAPLSSRPGIETTKVVEFSEVGNRVRMNPSKLTTILDGDLRTFLARVRVLCIVTTDGPTRVLKLCLMEKEAQDSVFGNPFGDASIYSSANPSPLHGYEAPSNGSMSHQSEMLNAAVETARLLKRERLPNEDDAVRIMFFGSNNGKRNDEPKSQPENRQDVVFSVRAEFSGFLISLIDSSPSEIAVASLKNVNALSRWNALRTSDASAIISVGWLQVDNHVPNAPFPVAIFPTTVERAEKESGDTARDASKGERAPLLVIGVTFAPKHKSGMLCLRSVTVAPRNLGVAIDLAFLVRLQRYLGGIQTHMKGHNQLATEDSRQNGTSSLFSDHKKLMTLPDVEGFVQALEKAVDVGVAGQKFYFGGLSILPCNVTLSVAPARALTAAQAALEGAETAAIHEAVRKGDVLVGGRTALLGVKVGRKNTTALAVVRGVLKSIVVDALLRLDGASLSFAGFSLRNHITTGSQLRTYLAAHYLVSLRSNVPALLGSLAALGNPLGLIRGLGDGVSDFVTEPVKGLKKSVKELDPFFLVDGVARGTESLARHAVGGFADSASLLTETFSKNMAVLTLDRRYAQKRDRGKTLRGQQGDLSVTFAEGVESGMIKLAQGFLEGVTGVVKAPLRGAEKKGFEGFAKGVGKGLLGLLVKPIIGISDAATDVMIGVKGSVESGSGFHRGNTQPSQVRPRRPMYGRDRVLRAYEVDDAAAFALMSRTRLAGENYLSHVDMSERVALLSVKRLLLLGSSGQEQLLLKFKHVASVEVRAIDQADGSRGWGIIVKLNTPRSNGSEIEVITCSSEEEARQLCAQIQRGANLVANET